MECLDLAELLMAMQLSSIQDAALHAASVRHILIVKCSNRVNSEVLRGHTKSLAASRADQLYHTANETIIIASCAASACRLLGPFIS